MLETLINGVNLSLLKGLREVLQRLHSSISKGWDWKGSEQEKLSGTWVDEIWRCP